MRSVTMLINRARARDGFRTNQLTVRSMRNLLTGAAVVVAVGCVGAVAGWMLA